MSGLGPSHRSGQPSTGGYDVNQGASRNSPRIGGVFYAQQPQRDRRPVPQRNPYAVEGDTEVDGDVLASVDSGYDVPRPQPGARGGQPRHHPRNGQRSNSGADSGGYDTPAASTGMPHVHQHTLSHREAKDGPQPRVSAPDSTIAAQATPGDLRSALHSHRSNIKKKYWHEQLDVPNYMDTAWVAPSRPAAIADGRAAKFDRGTAPFCISMLDLDTISVSIGLYFRLMKYLIVVFFAMSVIAIPPLWLCRVGHRVSKEDVDPLRLNIWSIGNVNTGNSTVFGRVLTAAQAGVLIGWSDFAYSVLFLLFVLFWKRRIIAVTEAVNEDVIQLSDYSVMVKHLPRTATAQQIHDHFNGLYNLAKEDWTFDGFCGCFRQKLRPRMTQQQQQLSSNDRSFSSRVMRAANSRFRHTEESEQSLRENAPVSNNSNTGNDMYMGSWIAEVTVVHPIGDLIRKFQGQQKRYEKIRIAKATMKRYNPAHQPDNKVTRKFRQAGSRLEKLQRQLDQFDKKHAARLTQDQCIGAFVVFNCEDSRRYCLEDYARSVSWWGRLTQETPLRFGDKAVPIQVISAPEPSDIIWENIEVTPRARFWRQLFTYLTMSVLLMLSIIFLAVAEQYKTRFQASVPGFGVCRNAMPQGAYGNMSVPDDANLVHNTSMDAVCGDNLFYFNYYSPTEGELAPNNTWGCPLRVGRASPRCVGLSDNSDQDLCLPRNEMTNTTLQTYYREAIAGCFCLNLLDDYIQKYGMFSAVVKVKDKAGEVCVEFAKQYLIAQALLISAACLVVIINACLKWLLEKVTAFERHETHTNFQQSVALKVFFAQFVNTGLIVLIVNIKLPYRVPEGIGILSGEFSSFDSRWNAVVGTTIVITMLFNIVTPHIPLIVFRLHRCFTRRKSQFRQLVTQLQADLLYRADTFNPSIRVPVVLNTVFITMAYCSSLPLLLPFAFCAMFVMYWVEKTTLLRFYARPPNMGQGFAELVSRLLPWALLLHLVFSVWMYGNSDGLASPDATVLKQSWTNRYQDGLERFTAWDRLHLAPKLRRQIVLPNAALFVVIVVVWLMWFTIRPLLRVFGRVAHVALCCCLCDRRHEHHKFHNPRFTAPFAIRMEHGTNWEPSPEDYARGLRLYPDPTRGDGSKVVMMIWTSDGVFCGVHHKAGEPKLTWQVMADKHFIVSYNMIANPAYAGIQFSMLETLDKFEREQAAILAELNDPYTAGDGVTEVGFDGYGRPEYEPESVYHQSPRAQRYAVPESQHPEHRTGNFESTRPRRNVDIRESESTPARRQRQQQLASPRANFVPHTTSSPPFPGAQLPTPQFNPYAPQQEAKDHGGYEIPPPPEYEYDGGYTHPNAV